mmetsp:Transcript_42832/g.99786  ORF Transcript_42832/g.99786 Transcript_42832/m.99786 type:complete len:530 (+) Transcript_42832:36-1625(+)
MAPTEALAVSAGEPQNAIATATPLQLTPLGAWDGTFFRLRSFPVVYRWQLPAHGESKRDAGQVQGVYYRQSMGRMILTYPLKDSDMDLEEEDFKVEMSCWQLKVSRKQGGTISELSQETNDDILRDLSWWKVDRWQENSQEKALFIYLAKATHRSWAGPWYPGALNPHKKTIFAWSARQAPKEILKDLKIDAESLKNIEPGEPEDWNHEISTAMTPEQICTGIDIRESDSLLQLVIHLDEEALQTASARVPLEEVFAADISSETLSVFLRGDSFSICTGRFSGNVVPEKSTWQITSVRRKNLPEGCTVKSPAFYNPALRITLTKAKERQGTWEDVFQDFQCCPFQLPRDRINWDERVKRCFVLSPGCPNNKVGKSQRAQALVKEVETSQDLLLNRVILLFHLEDKLLKLCDQQKLSMHDLFSMRIGARDVQVNFVADNEYPMCFGGLGGFCVPEASTWEIFIDEGKDQENPHPVLKLGLAKADNSRGRWEQVFTKWKPWESAKAMMEDCAAKSLEDKSDLAVEDQDEFD